MKNGQQRKLISGLVILLVTLSVGTGGYILGQENDKSPAKAAEEPGTAKLSFTDADFTLKTQAFSPDGSRKLMILAPRVIISGAPVKVILSDATGAHTTEVLRKNVTGDVLVTPTAANWSPDGAYVFVTDVSLSGEDLYVFKTNATKFSNQKLYWLASELGFPKLPFSATWMTNSQIQLIANQEAFMNTNNQNTYIFDIEQQSLKLNE